MSCPPDHASAGDRLEVLDAATFTTVHHQVFQPHGPLAAAGFLPSTAGGSSLVALQRGATLTGGIRLRLFAVPAGGEPLLLQVRGRGQVRGHKYRRSLLA